jgi:hypothetical protein
MVQILDEKPRSPIQQALLGAIRGAPEALETTLQKRTLKKEKEEQDTALEKLGIPKGIKDPKLREILLKEKVGPSGKSVDITEELKGYGLSDDEANLLSQIYKKSPQGGKTKLISDITERKKRGEFNTPEDSVKQLESPYNPEVFGDVKLEMPALPQEKGRTSAEQVRREDFREKQNTKIYDDISKNLTSLENQNLNLEQLASLNDTGKLPQGVERWKLHPKTGDLLVPAASTPETELYVKILNGFMKFAKDYFPGRVTNFDLQNFKTILPTLANTQEGRGLIIKQMDLTNRIAHLKDDLLKEVYDNYGTNKIDSATAKKIANENYKKLKPQLENELKNLTSTAQSYGNQLKNAEKIKSPYEKGTVATDEVADWYIKTYGPKLAEQKARDDGIEF